MVPSLVRGSALILALVFAPVSEGALIQVGSGGGGASVDNGATTDAFTAADDILQGGGFNSDITLSGFTGVVTGAAVRVNGMNHTWIGDISMQLLHVPTGNFITLMHNDRASADFANADVLFTDSASIPVGQTVGSPVPSGDYLPGLNGAVNTKTFATVFSGVDPNGTWRLIFADRAAGDLGSFESWDLQLDGVTRPGGEIPEPSTVVLTLFGAAGLFLARRRRQA
jgi:hypothetical protein